MSPEERMDKIRRKMEEMQEDGRSGKPSMPMGRPSLMERMAKMRGGPQDRMMIRTMNELRTDMQEIKTYLKEILENLES